MDESEDGLETLSMRELARSLWWLPWLCIVQIAYVVPRKFVAWVAEATTGRGVRYS